MDEQPIYSWRKVAKASAVVVGQISNEKCPDSLVKIGVNHHCYRSQIYEKVKGEISSTVWIVDYLSKRYEDTTGILFLHNSKGVWYLNSIDLNLKAIQQVKLEVERQEAIIHSGNFSHYNDHLTEFEIKKLLAHIADEPNQGLYANKLFNLDSKFFPYIIKELRDSTTLNYNSLRVNNASSDTFFEKYTVYSVGTIQDVLFLALEYNTGESFNQKLWREASDERIGFWKVWLFQNNKHFLSK